MYKRVFWIVAVAITLMFPAAIAQDAPQPETETSTDDVRKKSRFERRGDARRARIMEKYEATGETLACVPMRSLRQSIILDNRTIFFEGRGRRGYMNHLQNDCPGLLREQRFAYANSFGAVCRAEIITILDNFGRTWGSCGLGNFEEYKQKTKDTDDSK